jgi:hypothetical protein
VTTTEAGARTGVARVDNPFGPAPIAAAPGASASALIKREAQDIQVAMMIGRQFPRDVIAAGDRIINAFTRPSLCEDALYAYSKGGQEVSGLSIRAAEVLGQNWGNLRCGIQELSRTTGQSEFRAFAQDLETGFMDEKFFFVRHWIDTRSGGRAAADEREIYEIGANLGARRKRACILAVIPKDVQEMAERQIDMTLKTKAEVTSDSVKLLLEAFSKYHVTKEMIEKRIQRRLESMLPAQLIQMRRIFASLKDGMSTPEEWFEMAAAAPEAGGQPATTQTDAAKQALRAKQGAPKQDSHTPYFDEKTATAELNKAKTSAALDKSWGEILKDYEMTNRQLPDSLEPLYKDRKEDLGEREARQQE